MSLTPTKVVFEHYRHPKLLKSITLQMSYTSITLWKLQNKKKRAIIDSTIIQLLSTQVIVDAPNYFIKITTISPTHNFGKKAEKFQYGTGRKFAKCFSIRTKTITDSSLSVWWRKCVEAVHKYTLVTWNYYQWPRSIIVSQHASSDPIQLSNAFTC